MTIDLKIDSRIFNKVYLPFLEDTTRTQIFFGGSSSGKSVFLAQRCVTDILQGRRNYLVVRNVGATLKRSAFNEIVKAITRLKVRSLFKINQSDLDITCVNGYQILFSGLDNVEKVKSITPQLGILTDIWIEEATEIERPAYMQLKKRLRGRSFGIKKRLTLSFNPILQTHWIFNEFFGLWDDTKTSYADEKLVILKTTYKDNKFLAPDDIEELESETDQYFRNVYTLGNWGILGELIYRNWSMRDLTDMTPHFINRRHGLDFGFSQDPAAMPCTHYDRKLKTIYVYDELYMTQLTNDLLAREVKSRIEDDPIKCDSAEPKSIKEIRQHGVNAQAARKGKDSVHHGIQWLQQQTIVIDLRCQFFKNEIQAYQWKTDSHGQVLPVPIDKKDHLMDALRYAYEDEYLDNPGPVRVAV